MFRNILWSHNTIWHVIMWYMEDKILFLQIQHRHVRIQRKKRYTVFSTNKSDVIRVMACMKRNFLWPHNIIWRAVMWYMKDINAFLRVQAMTRYFLRPHSIKMIAVMWYMEDINIPSCGIWRTKIWNLGSFPKWKTSKSNSDRASTHFITRRKILSRIEKKNAFRKKSFCQVTGSCVRVSFFFFYFFFVARIFEPKWLSKPKSAWNSRVRYEFWEKFIASIWFLKICSRKNSIWRQSPL